MKLTHLPGISSGEDDEAGTTAPQGQRRLPAPVRKLQRINLERNRLRSMALSEWESEGGGDGAPLMPKKNKRLR